MGLPALLSSEVHYNASQENGFARSYGLLCSEGDAHALARRFGSRDRRLAAFFCPTLQEAQPSGFIAVEVRLGEAFHLAQFESLKN